MSNLDKYTFGNSPAAVVLVELLNEASDERQTRSVSRFLIAQNTFGNEVAKIENKSVAGWVVRMWRQEVKSVKLKNLSKKVQDFTTNVAVAKTREIERGFSMKE